MSDAIQHSHGTIELVLLDQINFDESYQRPVKQHARKIGKQFDPFAAGIPYLARRRDGSLWCIDGRQRLYGMHYAGLDRCRCFVIPSSGQAFEATLFSKINRDRKAVSQAEQFNAALTSGCPIARQAQKAAESAGLKIPLHCGGNRGRATVCVISCHGTLYQCVAVCGEEVVTRALRLLVATWPNDGEALSSPFVSAASSLLHQYGDQIRDERFARIVGRHTAREILQDAARYLGTRSVGVRLSLIRLYNSGLRGNKIPVEQTAD